MKKENTEFTTYNQQAPILSGNKADLNVPLRIPSKQFNRQSLLSIHANHQGK